MDSGPDPFAYEPDTVFCDGCGYRVPEEECTNLGDKHICEDCLPVEISHYIENHSATFVTSDDQTFEAFLQFLFRTLFGSGSEQIYLTNERYTYVHTIYKSLSEDEKGDYLEQFAAQPESGFSDWVIEQFGGAS